MRFILLWDSNTSLQVTENCFEFFNSFIPTTTTQ